MCEVGDGAEIWLWREGRAYGEVFVLFVEVQSKKVGFFVVVLIVDGRARDGVLGRAIVCLAGLL